MSFGIISQALDRKHREIEIKRLFSAAAPFAGKDASQSAIDRRRARVAKDDYSFFDETYFPPEMYDGQYAPSNDFHNWLAAQAVHTGRIATAIAGPHDHAKTATLFKRLLLCFLNGRKHFVGYAAETLETSESVISAVSMYLHDNQRIRHDFPDLEFLTDSADELHVRTHLNPRGTVLRGYSEDRSTRGKTQNAFFRFDLIVVDDFENRNSSFTAAAVDKRQMKLAEFQSSLGDNGCLIYLSNNFDHRCVFNRLVTQRDDKTLDPAWTVYAFPAWGAYYNRGKFDLLAGKTDGPLWQERFPATSEQALRLMLKPFDDATWHGSYQQHPKPPEGFYFQRAHYQTYSHLPDDCVGVVYTDPNLSLKGKGDNTALGALLYSESLQTLYPFGIRYKSYSDPNETFDDMRDLLTNCIDSNAHILTIAMDGNVNQESHWTNHFLSYCARKKVLFPPIQYCRFNVEREAKHAQLLWSSGRVRMPESFPVPDEGERFVDDFFAFEGRKRAGQHDDAPDWFVCAVRLLIDMGFAADQPATVVLYKHGAHNYRKRRRI